jgi:hypothetical protein
LELQKCIEAIKTHKYLDQEIIAIIADALSNNTQRNPDALVRLYCEYQMGVVRVDPYAILIDGVPIKEELLEPYLKSNAKAVADKANYLKELFLHGRTPCAMGSPCKNKTNCYLKIRIEGGNHKSTCLFCYECLRYLAITYLNTYTKDESSTILWKCICGENIPTYYFQAVLGKNNGEYFANLVKTGKTMYCTECGETGTIVKPGQKTTSIKCKKHLNTNSDI